MRWALACLIVGGALPLQAHAGQASCLLALNPAPTPQQLASAYQSGGFNAVTAVKDGMSYPEVLACGKPSTPAGLREFARITGMALNMYKVEIATSQTLLARGFTTMQLDTLAQAYRRGGLAMRESIEAATVSSQPLPPPDPAAFQAAFRDTEVNPGSSVTEQQPFRDYLFARIAREFYERKF